MCLAVRQHLRNLLEIYWGLEKHFNYSKIVIRSIDKVRSFHIKRHLVFSYVKWWTKLVLLCLNLSCYIHSRKY